ncbi:MAG: hypothetical protein LBB06_01470 [Endomicrobium sp.]|nr:hypothetical protein [Endomicrobium sp.]
MHLLTSQSFISMWNAYKAREIYEIMHPVDVGVLLESPLALGKHSGRHAFFKKEIYYLCANYHYSSK